MYNLCISRMPYPMYVSDGGMMINVKLMQSSDVLYQINVTDDASKVIVCIWYVANIGHCCRV